MADIQGRRRRMAEGHELMAQANDAYAAAYALDGNPEMVEHHRRMGAYYREVAVELRAIDDRGTGLELVSLPADIKRPVNPRALWVLS